MDIFSNISHCFSNISHGYSKSSREIYYISKYFVSDLIVKNGHESLFFRRILSATMRLFLRLLPLFLLLLLVGCAAAAAVVCCRAQRVAVVWWLLLLPACFVLLLLCCWLLVSVLDVAVRAGMRKDSDLWLLAVVRCDCAAAGMNVRSGRDPSGACQCCVCGNGWCVCPPGTSVCRGQWVNRGQGGGQVVVFCRDGSK